MKIWNESKAESFAWAVPASWPTVQSGHATTPIGEKAWAGLGQVVGLSGWAWKVRRSQTTPGLWAASDPLLGGWGAGDKEQSEGPTAHL